MNLNRLFQLGTITNFSRQYRDRNRISGEIPEEIFELTSLQLLDLDNNFLTGTISPSFENLQELSFMTIGNNLFEGQPMPEAFATLPNLGT